MTAEEKCAERFTEGTGGYIVCVDETQRHDTTVEVVSIVMGMFVLIILIVAVAICSIIHPPKA